MLRMGKQTKDEQPSTTTRAENQPAVSTPSYSYESAPAKATSSPDPVAVSRAVTESDALAKNIKEGNLSGFIGAATSFTGDTTFKAMLRVDGRISGNISSDGGTLIVSAGGEVDANIEVAVAIVNGVVNGDITASKRVELGRVAKVTGNIITPALTVEEGALLEGSCRMVQAKSNLEKQQSKEYDSSKYQSESSSSYSSSLSSDDSSYQDLDVAS
jgi:cytoskeletal protein CcmA (bactofilin family)